MAGLQYLPISTYNWCALILNLVFINRFKKRRMSQPWLYSYNLDSYCIHSLKSLGPIYFVKIRLPDFICNEFLIKMYRFLQNFTSEICTLLKMMNICCKNNIFTCRSLFTNDRKVDTWFCTQVHWFATVVLTRFLFSSLILMNIKMF